MGTFQNVTQAIPVTAKKNLPPNEGSRVVPLKAILTPTDFIQTFSETLGNLVVSQVRTLYIDNSQNAAILIVTHGVAQQSLQVPAGGGAFIPTTSNNGIYSFSVGTTSAPGGNTPVNIDLYNYDIPPAVWGPQIINNNNNSWSLLNILQANNSLFLIDNVSLIQNFAHFHVIFNNLIMAANFAMNIITSAGTVVTGYEWVLRTDMSSSNTSSVFSHVNTGIVSDYLLSAQSAAPGISGYMDFNYPQQIEQCTFTWNVAGTDSANGWFGAGGAGTNSTTQPITALAFQAGGTIPIVSGSIEIYGYN